jgi:TPR repeat protein
VLESGSFFLSLAQLTIKQKTGNLDPSDLKEVQKVCQGNLIGMGRVMLICINGIKGDGGRGLQYLEIYKDSLSVVENFSPHCLDAIAGQAVALYFEGNCERSAPLFEKIIDTPGSILSGNALLGYIYLCGLSYYGIGNAEAAKKRFKQVHELEPNNTEVINYLGNISNFENDPKAAISYFKEAADKGDPDGEFNYANMIYARSCITERNEAIAYLRRAVAKGHADAHFKLAEILSNGKTPLGNETIQLVCKSAELGSIEGAFLAGLFYINGVGVTVDMARGATLLLKAAENGHAHAADALGFLHKRSGNNNSSIEFFNRARELGHPNPGQEDPFQSEIPWGTIAAGVGAGLLALFGLS